MGRRTSLAALASPEVDDVPGQRDLTLLRVALTELVPTRFNPRRNFGTDEALRDFGLILKKRQLQPAVVVSRRAYLALWPDEADNVGNASYVIANGERRWRASQAAGLTHLDIVHREEVASSRAEFLDAVLSENNDREDLDPIERALGIETMVEQLGGASRVAEHYGKSPGWVSQQRKLLKLTDRLQQLISSGEMPVREGREIAGLPAGEQEAEWEERQQRRKAAAAVPRVRRAPDPAPDPVVPPARPEPHALEEPTPPVAAASSPVRESEIFTAVNTEPREVSPAATPAPAATPGPAPTAPAAGVLEEQAAPTRQAEPAAPEKPAAPAVDEVPWGRPFELLRVMRIHMTPAHFETLIREGLEMIHRR